MKDAKIKNENQEYKNSLYMISPNLQEITLTEIKLDNLLKLLKYIWKTLINLQNLHIFSKTDYGPKGKLNFH